MARASSRKKTSKAAAGGRRSPKQARARALVDAVVEATAQVLREGGPEAANTNRIAERAGVSIGSLYQYFPNKTALFTAVSERHVEQLEHEVQSLIAEFVEHPAEDLVDYGVRSFFAVIRVDAPLHAALQRVSLWGMASGVLNDFRQRTEAMLAAVLAARADEFETPVANPELAARVAVRALAGILDASILENPEAVNDEALIAETTRLLSARFGESG